MTNKTFIALNAALKSGNCINMYDALADNGLETDDVYANGENKIWLSKCINSILFNK